MAQNELKVQIAVVNWIKYNFPNILYCASAGGMRTSLSIAKKMKASGYVKGFPDLGIFHPTPKYHGMFIELKADKKGYATKEQKEWIKNLNDLGYYACVSKGFDNTIEEIFKYLNQTDTMKTGLYRENEK
tara:strand:- start:986 stop:1375 length:390 start_codon:yes stop_codon:yes gene_type:complete